MDSNAHFQKQLKQVFLETSKYFKRLSDIFGEEGFNGELPEAPVQSKRSKKAKEKAAKSEKSENEKSTGKGSKKKQKVKKDPNAPKKPLTAFMLFTNFRRPDIMKKNVGMKITEISTAIGKEWKALTEEEQNIWREKAKEDKLMYELKLFNYQKDQKFDEGEAASEPAAAGAKSTAVAKPAAKEGSAMNAISGNKREKSDGDSSIDSSSDDDDKKRQKTK
jgi:hypothetical protein